MNKLTLFFGSLILAVSAQAQIAYHDQRPDLTYSANGGLSYGYFGPAVGAAATCYDSQNSPIFVQVESFGSCAYGIYYSDYASGDGFTLTAGGAGYNAPDSSIIDDFQYSIDCTCLCVVTDYSDSYHGCWPRE